MQEKIMKIDKKIDKYLTEGKSYKYGPYELKIAQRIDRRKESKDYIIKKKGGSIRVTDDDIMDFRELTIKMEEECPDWGV